MTYWQIYKRDGCRYCEDAKKILKEKAKQGDSVEILDGPSLPKTIKFLQDKHDHHTYPLIFRNDIFIGGFNELQKLK